MKDPLIPTISEIQALDGRIVQMLTKAERSVLDFYLAQGRKFDVDIQLVSNVDSKKVVEKASSRQEVDEMLHRGSRYISVTVGTGAAEAWATTFSPNQ